MDTVKEMQNAKGKKGMPIVRLLAWIQTVRELVDLGDVDDTAAPAARGNKITQKALGKFLGFGHDWIKHAVRSQHMIDARDHRIAAKIVGLVRTGAILGAEHLYAVLSAAQRQPGQAAASGNGGGTGGDEQSGDDDSSMADISE